MPHLRNFNLLGFATLVALLSCITRISNGQCITNFDENVDYFANGNYQTIGSIDSLSGFSIQYNKYYKLLKNGRTGDTYALYLCGSKVPSDVPAGTKTFQVPVERVAIASGFDLVPYLELLGVRKKLKFHPSPANETSPCVEKMIASGAVTAFDANGDASQYDVLFTDGNDSAGLGNSKRVVVSASNKENGPLNRAEYLYFVSSFFNLEAVAKEVVPTIRKHYNCRKTELEKYYSTNPKPRVAWIKKEAGGSWTMNGLYERQLLSHAGVQPLDTATGLSTESLLERVRTVDVVIDSSQYPGGLQYQEYLRNNFGIDNANSNPYKWVTDKQVWKTDARRTDDGYDAWTEFSTSHPHLIMQDLTYIFQPTLQTSYTRRFIRNYAQFDSIRTVSPNQCASPINLQFTPNSGSIDDRLVYSAENEADCKNFVDAEPSGSQGVGDTGSGGGKSNVGAIVGGVIGAVVVVGALAFGVPKYLRWRRFKRYGLA